MQKRKLSKYFRMAFLSTLKTKEIGIRKVVGASVSRIIILLTKDFDQMGHHCQLHRLPDCLVRHEQMAAKFCLSD